MKKRLPFVIAILLNLYTVNGQNGFKGGNTLKGIVVNRKGNPIEGATVLQLPSFNAATSDSTGYFQLAAGLTDTLRLECSAIGFAPVRIVLPMVRLDRPLRFVLKDEAVNLKEVVISAGAFEASDEKKTTILKTFELATTPTATPDVFSAVAELPGTTKVGESEGLFVRGGAASETRAIIDGLVVDQPFFSAVPGVAQSSRFSSLMFKGTSFSSGGYSAQFGGALSSVLILHTLDLAQSSSTTFNINTTGLSANSTQVWNRGSLAVNASGYTLQPSFAFNRQNYDYQKAPEGKDGNLTLRLKGNKDGLFKFYGSWSNNQLSLSLPSMDSAGKMPGFNLHGDAIYLNSTYKRKLGAWDLLSGISYSSSHDHVLYLGSLFQRSRSFSEARALAGRQLNSNCRISAGSSFQTGQYSQTGNGQRFASSPSLLSNFAELEFYIGNRIAAKAGIRQEYAPLIRRADIAPRLSVAYVIDQHSQLSFAYGHFYQQPSETYLYTSSNLQFEKAIHYILSYQRVQNGRTFRTELYYKKYMRLVRELDSAAFEPFVYSRIPVGSFNNSGGGYARGFELFWYDKKTFSRLKYWVSYSFLDTRRIFANYPVEAMPNFAARHNVSVVAKYVIPRTTLNIGTTYNYTSGRPYYNPAHSFLSDKTPGFHDLILTANYAWFQQNNLFAIYVYVDNILGTRNINNFAFTGTGQRFAVPPPAYRSVFAGINITLAKRRSIMGINIQ